jgi:hypothetical protein
MSQHANALEEVVASEPLSEEAVAVVLDAIAHIKRLEEALRWYEASTRTFLEAGEEGKKR